MLSVPPRRFAASLVSRNGARTTSKRRRSERSVHSGECAFSTSESCEHDAADRVDRRRAGGRDGRRVGEQLGDLAGDADRQPEAAEQQVADGVAAADGAMAVGAASIVAGSIGGGSGASRSKSRNCSDICTPPSPSVIVWCIFCTSADLPPRRPSTTTNCHSGRVRSNGSSVSSVARSSSWRSVPGLGRAMWRTWWSMSKSGSSTHIGAERLTGAGCTRQRSRGHVPDRPLHAAPAGGRSPAGGRGSTRCRTSTRGSGSFSRRHIRPSASLILRSCAGRSATAAILPHGNRTASVAVQRSRHTAEIGDRDATTDAHGDGDDGRHWWWRSRPRPRRAAAWSARTGRSSSCARPRWPPYSDGVERYVTAFQFTGEGESVGSIVPLPDVPTSVERGGDWTLQRLALEVAPALDDAASAATAAPTAAADVEILLETEIDALDITVLRGGGDEVGAWALDNGFLLVARRPRGARLLRPPQPGVHGRQVRRGARRRARARAPATARRSWRRSRPTTRGCRCASSASASTPSQRVEADVFLLTDERARAARRRARPAPRAQRGGVRGRCSPTSAPTSAWSGCRTTCGCRTCSSTPPPATSTTTSPSSADPEPRAVDHRRRRRPGVGGAGAGGRLGDPAVAARRRAGGRPRPSWRARRAAAARSGVVR